MKDFVFLQDKNMLLRNNLDLKESNLRKNIFNPYFIEYLVIHELLVEVI